MKKSKPEIEPNLWLHDDKDFDEFKKQCEHDLIIAQSSMAEALNELKIYIKCMNEMTEISEDLANGDIRAEKADKLLDNVETKLNNSGKVPN